MLAHEVEFVKPQISAPNLCDHGLARDGENCRFSIAPSVDGLIESAENCDSAFSIGNRQSANVNENLVLGVANCHSAIMSLSELGTSYPKTGHLSHEFRLPFSLTP
jgi:hypothetical protein